jgi:plastocyanin
MTIDISKIKPGDKVTLVPLEVTGVLPRVNQVQLKDGEGLLSYFTPEQIAAHHPAPREIGVGDRVRWKDIIGIVRAVDGQEAWVRWDDYAANWSAEIQALTLVEGDQ